MGRLELNFYYGKEAEQFTFYRLPKALITDHRFKDVTNNAKLLYGLMLDRMSLSARTGWFDEENRVYIKYSVKSIMEDLNCSKMTAVGLLKELCAIGLIDMIQKNGLANIIYVKNFVSESTTNSSADRSENQTGRKSEPLKHKDQSKDATSLETVPVVNDDQSEGETGSSQKVGPVAVNILDPNNTKDNIEFNNTNHIYLGADEKDPMDEAPGYMELIRENIEYDIMMSSKEWRDRDMFDELYQLICDVVCVPRKTIRIGGEDYPYRLVKSKFLKLNAQHLQYVISCMEKNTTKVSNIRSYLITALYNSPNTISHYYNAEVNHDMYRAKGAIPDDYYSYKPGESF